MRIDESIGTVVTATTNESATAAITITANGVKIRPCKPGMSTKGMKTVKTVTDEASTAVKISVVALSAALRGDWPSAM